MKKITITLLAFSTCLSLSLPGLAQELPPGNVIVNTACTINDGHTFAEALEAARAGNFDGENSPNLIFYRQPIAGGNVPANGFLRAVYWENLAHWARGAGAGAGGGPLDEIVNCDNANRTFFVNRNIGQGNAYEGGTSDQTLTGAVTCNIKQGSSIADVYAGLSEFNAPFQAQGDTTLIQLSHRFLGPNENAGFGAAIIVRFVGENGEGLAARLDNTPKNTGSPPDAPVENCSEMSLWSSHVIHWGLPTQ